MKHGCIDFVDFIDKLVSRLQDDDQHILRTNHVTWLLAQIIRAELVMNALNTDSRKVIPNISMPHILPYHISHFIILEFLSFSIKFCFCIKV